MSETPLEQEPTAGTGEEGGYGYPSLEQEVTPEVLEEGAEGSGGGGGAADGDGEPTSTQG